MVGLDDSNHVDFGHLDQLVDGNGAAGMTGRIENDNIDCSPELAYR
jgi:hypothetical protein